MAGRPVANRFDVERALWDCKPGDTVDAVVLRDGEETQASLKLTSATDVKPAVGE